MNALHRARTRPSHGIGSLVASTIASVAMSLISTGTAWGTPFNGYLDNTATNAYAKTLSDVSAFDADQSFTFECWVYLTQRRNGYLAADDVFDILFFDATGTGSWGFKFRIWGSDGSGFRSVGQFSGFTTLNEWRHLAISSDRPANTVRFFVHGTQIGSTTFSYPLYNGTDAFWLGRASYQEWNLGGYIEEARFSNVVRYTGDFTPSSTPLTSDSNTLGLWHFDEVNGSTTFYGSSGNSRTLYGYNGAKTAGPPMLLSFSGANAL